MGKKKIATQTQEQALAEEAKVGSASAKSAAVKKSRRVESGRAYINSSYNNTTITITDEKGGVLAWSTAGAVGFSGPKKATPFAASKVVSIVAEKVKNLGLMNIDILVSGVGGGRDSAIRSLINHGFNVMSIKDVTPIPHNGPRPRKVRRV